MRMLWALFVGAALAGAAALVVNTGDNAPATGGGIVVDSLRADRPGSCGLLTVTPLSPSGSAPVRHRTTFVNGLQYAGMEDNDLRGFLDGAFRWGWNQVGQIHVRTGRKNRTSGFGEPELFRIIQRWDDVVLPPGSRIENAVLSLQLEKEPGYAGQLFLYEVKRDWNSGSGGTLGDNNSPPKSGEVWWNAAEHERVSWSLPGLGYADEADPNADTGGMPLAAHVFHDSSGSIAFQSDRLTRYVQERLARGQPLLFLIKLSDFLEDVSGTRLFFYSANEGDSRNAVRRPALELEWSATAVAPIAAHAIRLERGRSHTLPPVQVGSAEWLAATWRGEPGCVEPTIEGRTRATDDWGRLTLPARLPPGTREVHVRVSALLDPVAFGQSFVASLRDTWVETASPEDQEVSWTFISPSGRIHRKPARYIGDFKWEIDFRPDEIGPWQYFWTQRFIAEPFRSADGFFDVMATDLQPVLDAIHELGREIQDHEDRSPDRLLRRYAAHLHRLERAAVSLLGRQGGMTSERGREVRAALDGVRSLIAGRAIPNPIPFEPLPAHQWRLEDGR